VTRRNNFRSQIQSKKFFNDSWSKETRGANGDVLNLEELLGVIKSRRIDHIVHGAHTSLFGVETISVARNSS
jgi:hypothetical protein